ncbi:MAG: pitrilysin family protein [Gemmatimonadota bacterium]
MGRTSPLRRVASFRGRGREAASPSTFHGSTAGRGVDTGDIRVTTLPNGLRLLTERIDGLRSVAVGVWAAQGVVHEDPAVMGASHMLEHMVFKGTRRRSAQEIALSLESVGGSLDAYTSREHTSYQARVLDLHVGDAVDVLADLVRHPLLREEDLALEREVVLEEIAMVDDTPEDLIFDLHASALWDGHPYGYPILGSRETVAALSSGVLREIQTRRYGAGNLVIAAAGSLEHEGLRELVEGHFGTLDAGEVPASVPVPAPTRKGRMHVARDSAQTHVVLGGPALPHADPRRYALVLLSQALGGGMSSRLFQRIREEMGLAYAVYSFHAFYSAGGAMGVYLATRPATADAAAEAVREELARLAREGLPEEELHRVRSQVKGQLTLALESTGARLHRLAASALHGEPLLSLDETLARYDAVTADDVAAVASRFLRPEEMLSVSLGPGGD